MYNNIISYKFILFLILKHLIEIYHKIQLIEIYTK